MIVVNTLLPYAEKLGALSVFRGILEDETVKEFQPMGCNMGILPELPERIRDKKAKYTIEHTAIHTQEIIIFEEIESKA